MSTERKEGILIVTISIVALLILALLTEWEPINTLSYEKKFDFTEAQIQFDGFKTSCEYQQPVDIFGKIIQQSIFSSDYDNHGCKADGTKYILGFTLYFKWILIFALPIFSYGILRAFGIVRRLFPFEEKLFKCVEEKRKL